MRYYYLQTDAYKRWLVLDRKRPSADKPMASCDDPMDAALIVAALNASPALKPIGAVLAA